MKRWVWLNGSFSLEDQARIPVTDRGFLFGEGIFTTLRVHQGICELLNAHHLRFQRQAAFLDAVLPSLSFDWMTELIERNQAWTGTWRLKIILTFKQGQTKRTLGQMLATLHPYQAPAGASQLCLFPYPLETPLAHLKSLSYLDHLYVKQYAHRQGYEDAITKTQAGFLLETSSSNLFWIDQDICWVPDPTLPYLEGVFLQALLPHVPLPVRFIKATFDQLNPCARVYTCNALTHIRPVRSINQKTFCSHSRWDPLLQQATLQALEKDSMRKIS